jgi:hypothetical protein
MIKLMALGGEVTNVIAKVPTLKQTLVQMLADGKAAIVEKSVKNAQTIVGSLEQKLKEAASQAAAGQSEAAKKLDTAHKAWEMFLSIADKQKDKLMTEVSSMYDGHPFGDEVEKFFGSMVEPAIRKLKQTDLPGTLAAASKTDNAEERRKLLREGVQHIEMLQKALVSDPVLTKLDSNPFTPLGIAKAGNATLEKLKSTLEAAAA